MNGPSGFREDGEKLCRASHFSRQSRSSRMARTFRHTYRLLLEQRHQFGKGSQHLLPTHDHIALSAGMSTKTENVSNTIFKSQHQKSPQLFVHNQSAPS